MREQFQINASLSSFRESGRDPAKTSTRVVKVHVYIGLTALL